MKFRTETVEEFNMYCDTELTVNMTFQEAVDNIDEANNSYFYISLCENDVIEAIENEKELANQLCLDCVFISGIGVYVALHP